MVQTNYPENLEQLRLGIRITNLTSGQTIRTYDQGGTYEVQGTFLNPPGDDVFAFINIGGQWWPQPYSLRLTGDRTWSVKLHFGAYGLNTVSIVRANELGTALVKYYRKIVAQNRERQNRVQHHLGNAAIAHPETILRTLGGVYPAIEMGRLPKGFELQDQIEIVVEIPPN
jgi:hypothetical protein